MEVDRHTIQQNPKRKMTSRFKSSDCDNFERCNAPICPLDPDWRERVYLKGEAICKYQKNLSRGILGGSIAKELLSEVYRQHPKILAAWSPIFKKLRSL